MPTFFKQFFNKAKEAISKTLSGWQLFGNYHASFRAFGNDVNRSDLVRACVRALADQTAKAIPSCKDKTLEHLLLYRPNPFMTSKAFLYQVRSIYEIKNTCFILIMRDELLRVSALYPIKYQTADVLQDPKGELYVKFLTLTGKYFTFSIKDLIILRKDFTSSDIFGDDNGPLLETLDLISTSNQSISNAIKSTANLRGLVTTTKTFLDPEDRKKLADDFVKDYMSVNNEGGVAYLDSSLEFTPLNLTPSTSNWTTMREFRENLFRYFGVNDDILMGKADPETMQVFYETRIEPFLQELSLEMTAKIYTDRQIGFGNTIVYRSSTIQFMSMKDKLSLKDFVDRGCMTPNTWNDIVGLPHVEGGDEPIRRLDTAPVTEVAQSLQTDEPEPEEEEENKDA
jgi:HK97 family phage portal protein